MFTSPYMRKIIDCLEKITPVFDNYFLDETGDPKAEIREKLVEELRRCKDQEYYNAHYISGPVDYLI